MALARNSSVLLQIIGRLNPALYDVIFPMDPDHIRVPVGVAVRSAKAEPQPHPWLQRGHVGTVRVASAIADAAIAANAAGGDGAAMLMDAVDDWCGTPVPHRIPWPKKWPYPFPHGRDVDSELLTPAVQAEAAFVFGTYAAGIEDRELAAAFDEAGDKMAGVALGAEQLAVA